mgnify:FL=1|jgi:hypothetical protein
MRILSQDGMYDYPYEQSVVVIDGTEIRCCLCVGLNDVGTIMARYSTESRAKKATEMLREAYEASLWTQTHYDNSAQANVSDLFICNTIFQFPADEDMED